MKRTIFVVVPLKTLFFIFLLIVQAANAQESENADHFVETLVSAINSKSAESLDPWLAVDFSILGQNGAMASTVLHMLIPQLNDTVIAYHELQQEKTPKGLHYKYDFKYKNGGNKIVEVLFNQESEVKELKLVEGQVKILDQSNKPKVSNANGRSVINIPVKIKRNLILVDVVVNGKKQKFIIDSGSPRTILNAAYHKTISSVSSSKGITGQSVSNLDITEVKSLEMHGLSLQNEELLTADLSHLESALNTQVHGLVGTDLLEAFDIVFDYKNSNITLVEPDFFEAYRQSELNRVHFEMIPFITQQDHLPVVELKVNSKKFHVVLDCGASTNALNIDHQKTLQDQINQLSNSNLKGFSKTAVKTTSGKLKEVILGTHKYPEVKTVFTELSHLEKPQGIKIDGIIGYEILSQQKSIISYKRKQLLLEK